MLSVFFFDELLTQNYVSHIITYLIKLSTLIRFEANNNLYETSYLKIPSAPTERKLEKQIRQYLQYIKSITTTL